MKDERGISESESARRTTFGRNKWLFSFSGIGRDMAYQLIASFLLTYIQFGVSLTMAQFTTISLVIGVVGRIWDAINDPLMGAIIEGSRIRWGKFKPWILIGAISCGLVIMLMFGIQSIPGWNFVVFMCIMYLLWESTFTMNDIGYWSMLPSLSSVKEERNSVTMLTVLFAGIGAIIAQGVIPMVTVGDARQGYRFVGIAVALVFIIGQVITSVFVKETPRKEAEGKGISIKHLFKSLARNDQVLWMTFSMLFYTIASSMLVALASNLLYMEIGYNGFLYTVIVAAYGIPSVLVNMLYPALSKRFSRKQIQLVSIIAACAGYVALGLMGWTELFPFNIWAMCIFAAIISCGQSLFYMASIINMTNCVEYNDYKNGERSEAVVSTLRPFIVKLSTAAHTLIITLVLTVSGVYGLSQSISGLETQRDYFARMAPDEQRSYIASVKEYLAPYEGLEYGSPEYQLVAADAAAKLEADEALMNYRLNAEYLPALETAMITAQREGKVVELGRLGELDPAELGSEALALELGDLASGEESAANLNFRDKGTLSMRIWLRAAAAGVPFLFLIIALVIQRRKFIISEEFYDKMTREIAERNSTQR